MTRVKKRSDWRWNTSRSGGLTVGLVAGGTGTLYLKDPRGKDVTLHYLGVGMGAGIGVKIPRLNVSGSGEFAPASYPNVGAILIMDSFDGNELVRSDMTGPCCIAEVSAGLLAEGYSASVMLLGMSWMKAPLDNVAFLGGLLTSLILEEVIHYELSAAAMVVMGGASASLGLGTTALSGIMW